MRFCPDKFKPRQSDIDWAIESFNVTEKEVLRQLEIMRDHEFRRSYSDWNRVFRNWLRKADDIQTFKRDYKPRTVEKLSDEQRKSDAAKAWTELNRLKGIK